MTQLPMQDWLKQNIIGPYQITSTMRITDPPNSPHRIWDAVDLVPKFFLTNLLLLHLIWPGGLGYDPRAGNLHIHIDKGPRRRWREPHDQTF